MAYGDGSITDIKKRDGSSYAPKHWRICINLGTDPITGERIKVQRNFTGTKAAAAKLRTQIKAEYENGLTVKGERTTFGAFADEWHEARVTAAEVGKTRLAREKTIIEELKAYIGTMRVRDITPHTIEALYTRIRKDKTESRGKCSGTTMNMYHKLLKQILAKAVDYDIILRNPADTVKAPRIDPVDRRSLSVDEGRDLLAKINEAEEEAYQRREEIEERQEKRGDTSERSYLRGMSNIGNVMAARIGLATGMRRGEVMGLTWGHIDFKRGVLRVEQSVTVYSEIKEPKSEAGKRELNLDEKTMKHLAKWKAFQAQELAILCKKQTDGTPVCCTDKGEFMQPTNFSRWWRKFAEESGFPGLRYHELRHTQASQLVASGMDIKTVQHRLGHASASLTLNQYSHALPAKDAEAAQFIGDLFAPVPQADVHVSARKTA